jgi:hypothetical protein
MEEVIIAQVNPTTLEQIVYIISNDSERVPLIKTTTIEELPSVVAMSAAKYNIDYIKIAGPKDYTQGIRDILTAKVKTCFGEDNRFRIDLM